MGVKPLKLLKSKTSLLILILALGFFLRVYKIDSIPPGLTWDEAALGYNAYSISQTLRDEYGNFLPLILKSFGDYKPALYTYLDIPFIVIFGLTEFAVRAPSMLAGVGFILLCYLIIKKIFKNDSLALFVSFFAAISPLSIQFSRAGFESNVSVFLNMLGLYFFLIALKKPKYYLFSSIVFSLSLFTYQAPKMFVPLILIGLFIFFKKDVKFSKYFFWGASILTFSLLLIYSLTFLLGQADRLKAQSVFAYPRTEDQSNQIISEDSSKPGEYEFELFHGQWWEYIKGITQRYFIYFSPKVLFIEGDYSPRHSVPDLGILNYYGLLFIPFGLYLLFKSQENERKIILFWLFTSTIPAVLSRDLINVVRALNLVFPLAVLEGFGLYFLINKLSSFTKLSKVPIAIGFLFLVFINLSIYLDLYFVHFPKENSQGWMYGYKQVISELPDLSKYNNIVFTDDLGQPYIYYLFYTKYPPKKFQSQAKLEQTSVDVGNIRKLDNITFRKINWPADRGLENTLFIGTKEEIPERDVITEKKSKKLFQVDFLNKKGDLKIIENSYE